ncbi:MAG: DUF480 domain-containing protein [Propionibacteriaceae bacterium]
MTDLPDLDPEEQRVLGALLEKQRTVPTSYPLSLNALRTACNQVSSRDPVVEFDEDTVRQTARRLKDRDLIRVVWADTGRRTLKYHQILDETVELADDERALLTVLLLRGPQAAGELRSRTERLHGFADRVATETVLAGMAARGLVRVLPRQAGQHDPRWVHLLGPLPAAAASSIATVDREGPLTDGAVTRDDRVRQTYGAVAQAYAATFADELDGLPFERWLLQEIADEAPGPAVEVGCGPGQVTAFLAALDVEARGLDLSPEMVAEARRLHPDVRYDVGDLRRLLRPETASGWGAVLGWYSLIHLAGSELPAAVAGLARTLVPGGLLVLALHAGLEVRHLSSWFDLDVDLDVVLHDPAQVVATVRDAGLVDLEWYHRGPVVARGETSERLYVLARAPG